MLQSIRTLGSAEDNVLFHAFVMTDTVLLNLNFSRCITDIIETGYNFFLSFGNFSPFLCISYCYYSYLSSIHHFSR